MACEAVTWREHCVGSIGKSDNNIWFKSSDTEWVKQSDRCQGAWEQCSRVAIEVNIHWQASCHIVYQNFYPTKNVQKLKEGQRSSHRMVDAKARHSAQAYLLSPGVFWNNKRETIKLSKRHHEASLTIDKLSQKHRETKQSERKWLWHDRTKWAITKCNTNNERQSRFITSRAKPSRGGYLEVKRSNHQRGITKQEASIIKLRQMHHKPKWKYHEAKTH